MRKISLISIFFFSGLKLRVCRTHDFTHIEDRSTVIDDVTN